MTAGDATFRRSTPRHVAEALLFALVGLAPWPFGCTTSGWNLALAIGILAALTVWVGHAIRTRRFSYRSDPVALCLLGLVLLTGAQLVPLPAPVVRAISPTAWELHHTLVPAAPELIAGESEADVPHRSAWLRLSTAPVATEDLFAQLLAVFLVYAVARNFAAGHGSLSRLAWVACVTGGALALLGIAQHLAGPKAEVYPRIDASGFGPFANKNHFAFQLNLFAGLTGGLLVSVARRRRTGWSSPVGLTLLGALGLMATAIVFSQSRGGVVAAVVAALVVSAVAWSTRGASSERTRTRTRTPLPLLVGVALVVVALIAWLGWRGAGDRLATLGSAGADNRTADWLAVWPLVERFPLTGVGGGALATSEPLVRTRSDIGYRFNTLDNEYLEALVEGGIPRLALTLALAIGAVWTCVRGFRQKPDSPNAPLLLGCGFGMVAVAVHSFVDFGLHIPSVALAAAVIAALARATVDRRDDTLVEERLRGSTALVAAGAVVLGGLLVVLADLRTYRVEQLRDDAQAALRARTPTRFADALRTLEAATRVRPNDPAAWEALTAVHLLAAAELQQTALAAVGGSPAFAIAPERSPSGDPGGHVTAALVAARRARAVQPLDHEAHLILGRFADRFARSEPPAAHFDRAKKVAGFDPLIWYASGKAAFDRGDWPTAWNDWRESLARSPRRLGAIARQAARQLAPDEVRSRVLPDDPELWFAATRFVCPAPGEAHTAWLKATAERWSAGPEPTTVPRFTAWAATLEQLGDVAGAVRVWRAAVERFPNEMTLRDRLAALLEADERYADAVPVLEWLVERQPDRGDFRHRLEAARHALKLLEDIGRP